jgi:hypothetical protein
MLEMGNGSKTFYVVAEAVNMGMSFIDIKLTDNKNYAKANVIIGKIKAETKEEAKEYFRVRDMIY